MLIGWENYNLFSKRHFKAILVMRYNTYFQFTSTKLEFDLFLSKLNILRSVLRQ